MYQFRRLLRQKEAIQRHVPRGGKFAEGHGGLIAGVAAGAEPAVFQHFVAEDLTVGYFEVEVLEERGDASEEADTLDAAGIGLAQKFVNELTAGSAAFDVGTNDDGADLGEMRAVDVEGCAAEKLMGMGFDDGEGADVAADFSVGAGKEGPVVGEAVD